MIYDKLNNLDSKLSEKRFRIEMIKRDNERSEEIRIELEKNEKYLLSAKNYLRCLNTVLDIVKKEDSNFKQRRLGYLEDTIKDKLDYVYTEDSFTPKIIFKVERNKPRVKLKISKNNGKFTNPVNSEGGLAQQIVNFSSSMSIVSILQKNKFYIDEAFGASSPDNLEKLGRVLEGYSSKGMQLFLISQGSSLYQDLPRREIHLKSIENKVSVSEIIDWGE